MSAPTAGSEIAFTINGLPARFEGDPETSLLRWLRDVAGITSAKDGCSPQAACGCCTVELNGKPVLSCVTAMKRVNGGAVVTVEGLSAETKEAFSAAFTKEGGIQCGFCTPGIVMRAQNLVGQNPHPSDADVAKSLSLHLCRCTGYKKIVDSIKTAAEALHAKIPVEEPPQTGRVGTRLPKVACKDTVLGQRAFVADLHFEGQLHGALRMSDHPRARVARIDASAARAIPGVERVFTAADVPGERHVGLILKDWPLFIAEGETTCYVGNVIAAVAASTREIAQVAVKAIRVDYEILSPVLDPDAALAPDAPVVNPKAPNGNLLGRSVIQKGDAKAALEKCAFVSEGTYQTQWIEHAYLETEACVAMPDGDGVRVYSQSQGVYEDRRQIALLLRLPECHVHVELLPSGGGFGGKEDLSVQGHAALMARLLGKPVKLELTREESILMHPKRHPLRLEYRLGCSADGKLQALYARITGDSGAHASVGMKVLERAAGHCTGAYEVPNVDVVATAVYTNNIPCGAMRGFGANQATYAMECCVDELCEKGGFDRWQFRWDNALTEGCTTATGQILTSGVGVRETLEAVKEDFRKAKHAGIACGIKNTGIGNGMPDIGRARVRIVSSDRVEIHHGWTEMGQGVDTMAVHSLCEETGIRPDIVVVRSDTADETPCGMTTSSRATSLVGNSVIDACKKLNEDLKTHSLGDLAGRDYDGFWICDWTTKPGYDTYGKPIITHYSYSYATQVVIVDENGNIDEVVAAHDVGRVMNPTLFEGQVEGAVAMGLGYALTEDLPMKDGRPVSLRLRDCGLLRARQMPKMRVIGVEVPDEFGPYGAKGVGEIGLVPTAGAVANALWAFDGKRRRSLPMKRSAET